MVKAGTSPRLMPRMTLGQEVIEGYLSLRAHSPEILRPSLPESVPAAASCMRRTAFSSQT